MSPNGNFSCVYNVSVCTTTISSTMSFRMMTDDCVKTLQGIPSWHGGDDEATGHPGYYNLRYVNEVLRYSAQSSPDTSFETGFIDSLNVHNSYTQSCNLGPYSSIGVRGENTKLLKQLLVHRVLGILLWIQLLHLMEKTMCVAS